MSIHKLFKKNIYYIRYDPKKFWNKQGIFLECNKPEESNKINS